MPLGLCNAPATFKRLMEVGLNGLQWITCLIYLDDVIIYGSSFDGHINRLEAVLLKISLAGLKLKPEKCHFYQEEVAFLGHLVSGAGVLPHPDNIQKLLDWPVTTNVTEVRGILYLGNDYSWFVRDFSKMVHPLTELTKKEAFIWTGSCQEAFETQTSPCESRNHGFSFWPWPVHSGHRCIWQDNWSGVESASRRVWMSHSLWQACSKQGWGQLLHDRQRAPCSEILHDSVQTLPARLPLPGPERPPGSLVAFHP